MDDELYAALASELVPHRLGLLKTGIMAELPTAFLSHDPVAFIVFDHAYRMLSCHDTNLTEKKIEAALLPSLRMRLWRVPPLPRVGRAYPHSEAFASAPLPSFVAGCLSD